MAATQKRLPLTAEIEHAMEVAKTQIDASRYLVDGFKKILTDAKLLDKSGDILEKLEEFAKLVEFRLLSSAQPWSGQASPPSDFKNMQIHLAENAAEQLGKDIEHLQLDIAINDQGQLLRGYSSKGKVLDAAQVDSLDKLFNAWLVEHDVMSKDSTLHESDENGQIRPEKQNEQAKKQTSEKVKNVLNDQENGFSKYLKDKGCTITIVQRDYPTTQTEVAHEPVSKVEAEQVEPQSPKSSGG